MSIGSKRFAAAGKLRARVRAVLRAAFTSLQRRMSLPSCAAAFVVLVCSAIIVLSVARGLETRSDNLRDAEMDLKNIARAVVQHAEDSFDLLDASIIGIVNRLETYGTDSGTIANLQGLFKNRKAALPRISLIALCDANGDWLASSGPTGTNLSARDFFQRHLLSPARGPFIGRPFQDRDSGAWSISVSRRMDRKDGSFAGVVFATIESSYFADFYRKFEMGQSGTVAMLSEDGIVLARNPDDGTYVGRDLSMTRLIQQRAEGASAGLYPSTSPLDGVLRLGFYNYSGRFPLVVLATRSRQDVLAQWQKNAVVRVTFIAALTMLIAILGAVLVWQLHLRHRLMDLLKAKEGDFRTLAEQSSDMVTRIGSDLRFRYVSPSSLRVVGWRPHQLIGKPALTGVHPEDLEAVNETVAAFRRGEITEARLVYRTMHRRLKEVWIESTMSVTRDAETIEVDGVVAISRDVTERKRAEDRLAAIALLDGLTSLANRRWFDERLQEEWVKAHHAGMSISLLMIDVDHFKEFNDLYGHPAGDACLRSVAQAVAAAARRPSDMAARYGGEEFVLLLPNTDRVGCELVGDAIRRELQKLAVVHEQNLPSGCVTVSIGGATAWPKGNLECASLIVAADRALYAAKDGGRDRLIIADQATLRSVAGGA